MLLFVFFLCGWCDCTRVCVCAFALACLSLCVYTCLLLFGHHVFDVCRFCQRARVCVCASSVLCCVGCVCVQPDAERKAVKKGVALKLAAKPIAVDDEYTFVELAGTL